VQWESATWVLAEGAGEVCSAKIDVGDQPTTIQPVGCTQLDGFSKDEAGKFQFGALITWMAHFRSIESRGGALYRQIPRSNST
jgi:hypothetical protein